MGAIMCKSCGVIIISSHRHDYQECGCSNNAMIDGGNDYCRCGAKDLEQVELLYNCLTCSNMLGLSVKEESTVMCKLDHDNVTMDIDNFVYEDGEHLKSCKEYVVKAP